MEICLPSSRSPSLNTLRGVAGLCLITWFLIPNFPLVISTHYVLTRIFRRRRYRQSFEHAGSGERRLYRACEHMPQRIGELPDG
jgi:hypothetical protein